MTRTMAGKLQIYFATVSMLILGSINGSLAATQINISEVSQNTKTDTSLSHSGQNETESNSKAPHDGQSWLKGGYFHPMLAIQGDITDNLYNINDNKTNDFLTTFSPGIWLAVPRSREKVLSINSSNYTPGGLRTDLEKGILNSLYKFQSYLIYEADFLSYSSENDNNFTGHSAEGLFRYDFSSGLSVQSLNKFLNSFDEFMQEGSQPGSLNEFNSNLFLASVQYPFGSSLSLRGDYSNFYLDYDENKKSFSNRSDNKYGMFLYYDYSPKTSLFVNGEIIQLNFDTAIEKDADIKYVYAGTEWQPTDKVNLRVKLGYVKKDFDDSSKEGADGFSYELNALWNITEKTYIQAIGSSKIQVPNVINYDYVRRNALTLIYLQNITDKIRTGLQGAIKLLDYQGGEQADRDDDLYTISPYIQIKFRDWLGARLGYTYKKRSSNYSEFDYTTNTFYLKMESSF